MRRSKLMVTVTDEITIIQDERTSSSQSSHHLRNLIRVKEVRREGGVRAVVSSQHERENPRCSSTCLQDFLCSLSLWKI